MSFMGVVELRFSQPAAINNVVYSNFTKTFTEVLRLRGV